MYMGKYTMTAQATGSRFEEVVVPQLIWVGLCAAGVLLTWLGVFN